MVCAFSFALLRRSQRVTSSQVTTPWFLPRKPIAARLWSISQRLSDSCFVSLGTWFECGNMQLFRGIKKCRTCRICNILYLPRQQLYRGWSFPAAFRWSWRQSPLHATRKSFASCWSFARLTTISDENCSKQTWAQWHTQTLAVVSVVTRHTTSALCRLTRCCPCRRSKWQLRSWLSANVLLSCWCWLAGRVVGVLWHDAAFRSWVDHHTKYDELLSNVMRLKEIMSAFTIRKRKALLGSKM